MQVKYRFHAIRRMFERKISEEAIVKVLTSGKVIEDYPEDLPYPSCLMLGFVDNRPIHVVTAVSTDEQTTIVITVYEPDPLRWELGFEKRK